MIKNEPLTACKQYCLAAGATQGNIAYTQTVTGKAITFATNKNQTNMKKLLLTMAATIGMTASTMAQNVPNYVPPNGLVGWWPFNGNANDESGNNNNGTVNGASLTIDRFGNSNNAYNFISTNNNYISVNNNPVQNGIATISGWFNASNPIGGPIFHIGADNSTQVNCNGYFFGFGTLANPLGNTLLIDASCHGNYSTGWNAISNVWYHFILVRNQNNLTAYINGNLVGSYTPSSINPPSNSIFFGSTFFSNSVFYNGKIDDIGIWNRALTQQEISDLYNAVNCANNTSISPQTNSLNLGSAATFTASTTDPNPSYVWQSDFGQGYVNLNNYGNYSGTNTGTLNVANVQLSEHNQPIRVITTSGNCIDTSNVAIISITDTCINTIIDTTLITVIDTLLINTTITSLNPPNNANTIKVFPNPTNDHITIDYGNFSIMNGYQLKIENSLGQQVFQTNINQQSDYLSLTNWGGNGLYFVRIIDPLGNTIDIRKIVLQ